MPGVNGGQGVHERARTLECISCRLVMLCVEKQYCMEHEKESYLE